MSPVTFSLTELFHCRLLHELLLLSLVVLQLCLAWEGELSDDVLQDVNIQIIPVFVCVKYVEDLPNCTRLSKSITKCNEEVSM